MIELETNSPLLRAARRDTAKAIEDQGPTSLQLSTILALASVGLMACIIWLT
jgi:hypothetical protein